MIGNLPKIYDKDVKNKRMVLGVAMLLFWQDKILLARRLSKNYHGKFGVPGGKVEFGESPLVCGSRETEEETSLKPRNVNMVSFIASYMKGDAHYICLWACGYVDKPTNWDGVVNFIEYDKHDKPKTDPWMWYTRKEIDKLDLMPSVKEAWDYYLTRPGVPYASLYHQILK